MDYGQKGNRSNEFGNCESSQWDQSNVNWASGIGQMGIQASGNLGKRGRASGFEQVGSGKWDSGTWGIHNKFAISTENINANIDFKNVY